MARLHLSAGFSRARPDPTRRGRQHLVVGELKPGAGQGGGGLLHLGGGRCRLLHVNPHLAETGLGALAAGTAAGPIPLGFEEGGPGLFEVLLGNAPLFHQELQPA